MVKFAEVRQTAGVMNKVCRPEQLNHVAKPSIYNLDIVVIAMFCDSSCLHPVLQNARRDVANDQTQKTSHSYVTVVLEAIIVHFPLDSTETGLSLSPR